MNSTPTLLRTFTQSDRLDFDRDPDETLQGSSRVRYQFYVGRWHVWRTMNPPYFVSYSWVLSLYASVTHNLIDDKRV